MKWSIFWFVISAINFVFWIVDMFAGDSVKSGIHASLCIASGAMARTYTAEEKQ